MHTAACNEKIMCIKECDCLADPDIAHFLFNGSPRKIVDSGKFIQHNPTDVCSRRVRPQIVLLPSNKIVPCLRRLRADAGDDFFRLRRPGFKNGIDRQRTPE